MNKQPRRPAQLEDAQIEAIEGDADVAYNSELAHTSAQALIPMGTHFREKDRSLVARILDLVDEEGVDVVAETWVRSPEDSLPGILWRGYLLREWIRRDKDDVARRYEVAKAAADGAEAELPKPGALRQEWDLVLAGAYEGDFAELLDRSARLAATLGGIESVWIAEDSDPLATEVTRRRDAFASTAREFEAAAGLVREGCLE
mgnify:FL=1